MKAINTIQVGLAVCLLSPLACDKGTQGAAPPDPSGPAPEAASDDGGGAEKAWADMSLDDKKKHMAEVVTPKMMEVFQGANAERYAGFNCATCHGPGANEGKFAMPSPDLPKIPANGAFEPLMQGDKADVTKFMIEAVVPQMADALGIPAYNPETHEGFGCYGCHQSE